MYFSLCGKEPKHPPNIMEQHFQDMSQKAHYGENLDTFADHFARHFDQKPTTQ